MRTLVATAVAVVLVRPAIADTRLTVAGQPERIPIALRVVPYVLSKVVQKRDCAEGVSEALTASTMIAEHAPILEPCERVLDACSAAAMTSPRPIAHHLPPSKDRRDEADDSAITTVCEDATMRRAQGCEPRRGMVVNRIVAIARAGR